jgi:hypothetical protein
MRVRVLLLLMAGLLVVGLAACGDDDGEAADPTTATVTAPLPAEEAYADALRDASSAVSDLAAAVVSGDDPATVAASITAALAEWEDAVARAGAAGLADASLAGQRDALVASSPAFVGAWTAVAEEWATSGTNGLLELVQRRSDIADATRALAAAVDGALAVAGEEARSALEGVRAEITSALERIASTR